MLILASQSPRRRELLTEAGLAFVCEPAKGAEPTALPDEPPADFVRRCALHKAREIAASHPDDVVLGADTVVVFDGHIYGKPHDETEAAAMLSRFSGHPQQVLTGVALLTGNDCRAWTCVSQVHFRTLDETVIRRYIGLVKTTDKAGAYAIQEHGEMLIDHIEGLRSNIIGLPVEEVAAALAESPFHERLS